MLVENKLKLERRRVDGSNKKKNGSEGIKL